MINVKPSYDLANALAYASKLVSDSVDNGQTSQERADILAHGLEIDLMHMSVLVELRRAAISVAAV